MEGRALELGARRARVRLQLALLVALAIVALLALGATGSTLGLVVIALLAVDLLFLLRLAWDSFRSAAVVERALEQVPGDPAPLALPRSHLVLPPLMLVPRGVRKRRGVVYHTDGRLRLRLDVYEPVERGAGSTGRDRP